MAVFGDDLGFFAGQALAEQANTEQKVILAEALGQERAEKNAILFAQKNQMNAQINKLRLENLMALAEYEYDIHVVTDVSYDLRKTSDELRGMAEQKIPATPENLMLLSDRLAESRAVHRKTDRDNWIGKRYKQLVESCSFPKNDQEAAMAGGYAMPFPGSVPPFLRMNTDDVNRDVYRVLTDQDELPAVQSKMQRGPMKIG